MTGAQFISLLFAVSPCIEAESASRAAPSAEGFSVAAVLTHMGGFDPPHDIELQGNVAFISGKGSSLAVIDASKRGWLDAFHIAPHDEPFQVGAVDLRSQTEVPSPHDVDLIGHHAVVADPGDSDRSGKLGQITLEPAFNGEELPSFVRVSKPDWPHARAESCVGHERH